MQIGNVQIDLLLQIPEIVVHCYLQRISVQVTRSFVLFLNLFDYGQTKFGRNKALPVLLLGADLYVFQVALLRFPVHLILPIEKPKSIVTFPLKLILPFIKRNSASGGRCALAWKRSIPAVRATFRELEVSAPKIADKSETGGRRVIEKEKERGGGEGKGEEGRERKKEIKKKEKGKGSKAGFFSLCACIQIARDTLSGLHSQLLP